MNFTNQDKFERAKVAAKKAHGDKMTDEHVKEEYLKLGGRIEGDTSTYIGAYDPIAAAQMEKVHEKSGKEVESLPRPKRK